MPRVLACSPPVATLVSAVCVLAAQPARATGEPSAAGHSVALSGVLDAAVRRTTHEQSPGAAPAGKTQVIGGGMSQSRLAIDVAEPLSAGTAALVNLEHRLALDAGATAGSEFWQQASVGLKTPRGRLTWGRQYNVLFDVWASSYASFKYSPFIEAYKPELGFSLGSRTSNMLKFAIESGPWIVELQASPGEGAATGGKSLGGMLRYALGAVVLGGAYLELGDSSGRLARATTAGASWSSRHWVVTAGMARNRFDAGYNPALILAYLTSSTTNGLIGPNMDHRDGYSIGATFQIDRALNVGAQVWRVSQAGVTADGTGSARFGAIVVDYALSRRSDVYVELDHTRFAGAVAFPNGATSRRGAMVGLRQRF